MLFMLYPSIVCVVRHLRVVWGDEGCKEWGRDHSLIRMSD